MKLTKGVISREEALKIDPKYVEYAEGNFDHFQYVWNQTKKLKKNQKVLTYQKDYENDTVIFVLAKISLLNHNDFRAVDGPLIRVSNGEYSWRVDGSGYAVPIVPNKS